MPKLTKRYIDSIKPAENKDVVVWDDDLPGFGIRTKPSGWKSFIIQYRNAQGRSRRVTIGVYGRMTPSDARKQAREALVEVDKGQDPAENKKGLREALSVSELAHRYIVEHAEPKKKPLSVTQDRRLLEKIILPVLGHHQINAVTRPDIAKLHHDQRDTPFQANRVIALCSKMFNLAEKWGLRPDGTNPCRHVERYKEPKRERFLSGDELSRLGEALSEAEVAETPSAITALRLLLFTGCRLSEILALRWSEVDLDRGLLNIPDSKTGSKLVPLPGPALDVLLEAPRISGNPFVCPGAKAGSHLVGLQKIWNRIRTRADLEDVRHHDLRHSFASVAAAANMGLPIIGKLLGHTQAATTARYAHLSMDPLKAASEKIAGRIDKAMKKKPARAKIIELKR